MHAECSASTNYELQQAPPSPAGIPEPGKLSEPVLGHPTSAVGTGVHTNNLSEQDAKAQKMSRFVELAKKKMADLQSAVAARNATIDSQETTISQLNVQLTHISQQVSERVSQ
jgi:hypothetical protein